MFVQTLLSVIIYFLLMAGKQPASAPAKDASDSLSVYLFSYFTGNGEDGLHLAYSTDGLEWNTLNDGKSFLQPQVGESKLMRDPCITTGPKGRFHMVWTTSWEGRTVGYAHSDDLMHWSEQKAIPVMAHEPDAQNCWAPEIYYDETLKQFIIYWSTTISGRFPETDSSTDNGRNHRIYYTLTQNFEDFTPSKLLYEPGFNVIDGSIVKMNGRYAMFIKNETLLPNPEKNIRITYSDELTGPYGKASEPITGNYWAEGPTAIEIEDTWYMYFDKYRQGKFGLLTSRDGKNWIDQSAKLSMPEDIRHGTIFEVSYQMLENILDQ